MSDIQEKILSHIAEMSHIAELTGEDITPSDIAEDVSLPKQTVMPRIAELERNGQIVMMRTRDGRPARVFILH